MSLEVNVQTELSPQPGQLVGGKYRLSRLIGQGAMGAVYEAEHTGTGKRVAIKWLHPHVMENRLAVERLMREAQASARVRHLNVVDVYDVEREGDALFLVMEYLEGEPLTNMLDRGGVPFHVVLGLIQQAMRGVAEAHRQGIVHRDIKPDNIFLAYQHDRPDPIAKVLDFGISKMDAPGGGLSLTQTGSALGTPLYMSFEQLSGQRDVDLRSDVYAFGVIMYEALTGMLPYSAENFAELAAKVITSEPPTPRQLRPEIPEHLEQIILWAMSKRREERPANLGQLIDALQPYTQAPVSQNLRDSMTTRATSLPPPPGVSSSARRSGARVHGQGAVGASMQPASSLPPPRSSRPHYDNASHSGARMPQSSSPPPVQPLPSTSPPSLRLPTQYDEWDDRNQRARREMESRVTALMAGTMSDGDYRLPKRSSGAGVWMFLGALAVAAGGAAYYKLQASGDKPLAAPTSSPTTAPAWPPPASTDPAPAASEPAHPAPAEAPVAPPPEQAKSAQAQPAPADEEPQQAAPEPSPDEAKASEPVAKPADPPPAEAPVQQAEPASAPTQNKKGTARASLRGQQSWRPAGESTYMPPPPAAQPVAQPVELPPEPEKPKTIEVPGTAPNPFADEGEGPSQDDATRYRAGRPSEEEF